jgi:ankyrin repeat protein
MEQIFDDYDENEFYSDAEVGDSENESESDDDGADTTKDLIGKTLLSICRKSDYFDVAKILLNKYMELVDLKSLNTKKGINIIHRCCESNNVKFCTLLLEKGCIDVNQLDIYGRTPLHYSCYNNSEKMTSLLIKNGADAKIKDKDGNTALHFTVQEYRNINTVKISNMLIHSVLNHDIINIRNNDGNTVLHVGCIHANNKEVILLLLDKGGDVHINNNSSYTPLTLAVIKNNREIVPLLLNNGANAEGIGYNDDVPVTLHGVVRSTDSPLHIATENGYLDLATLLIENGANVNKMCNGFQPIHKAFINHRVLIILLLIKHGATIYAIDDMERVAIDSFQHRMYSTSSLSFEEKRSELTRERSLIIQIYNKESNWRRRKSFIMFLVQSKYINNDNKVDHSLPRSKRLLSKLSKFTSEDNISESVLSLREFYTHIVSYL